MIFIIIMALLSTQLYISFLRGGESALSPVEEKALEEWVSEVKASVAEKNWEKPSYIAKSDYQPLRSRPKSRWKSSKSYLKENTSPRYEKKAEVIKIADLNTASSSELQKVKGIGPAFSERIVKYRRLLGGFSSTDQLTEVYGLEKETITELLRYFEIQTEPSQIDINTDSAKVLARHPYISYDLAWIIINYRKQNGDITSIEEFGKIQSLNEEMLERLRPYLQP